MTCLDLAADSRPYAAPRTNRIVLAVCALAAAALILHLFFLGRTSLWDDEFFSVYYPRKSLADLWGADWLLEPTPPLFYMAMALWQRAFGTAEPVLRLFPVLFSAATVPVIYLLGRKLAGTGAGLIAAALFVLAPIQFDYALEIRTYSLQGLVIAAGLWALARLLRRFEANTIRTAGDVLRDGWPVALSCVVALYLHSTSIFYACAVNGAFLLTWIVRRRGAGAPLLGWAGLQMLVVLAVLPELVVIWHGTHSAPVAWVPRPTAHWIYLTVRSLLLGQYFPFDPVLSKPAAALLLALLGWSAWRARRDPVLLAIGVAMPVLGMAGLIAASMIQPILLTRTALWITLPLLALLAAGLRGIPDRRVRGAALVLSLGLFAAATAVNLPHREMQPWRTLIAEEVAAADAQDIHVAIDAMTHCALDYYAGAAVPEAHRRVIDLGPEQHFKRAQLVDLDCNQAPTVTASGIAGLLASGKGVWITARGPASQADLADLLAEPVFAGRVVTRIDRDPHLTVVRLKGPAIP